MKVSELCKMCVIWPCVVVASVVVAVKHRKPYWEARYAVNTWLIMRTTELLMEEDHGN